MGQYPAAEHAPEAFTAPAQDKIVPLWSGAGQV